VGNLLCHSGADYGLRTYRVNPRVPQFCNRFGASVDLCSPAQASLIQSGVETWPCDAELEDE
jgi:hypothetical protein